MGAQEVFRSEPGVGGATRIGFTIGKAAFAITSRDDAGSDDGLSTLSLLAADFGASFAAIVLYVRNQVTAAQHAPIPAVGISPRRRPVRQPIGVSL